MDIHYLIIKNYYDNPNNKKISSIEDEQLNRKTQNMPTQVLKNFSF